MGNIVYKHTLSTLLLFLGCWGFAQKKYETSVSKSETILEGKALVGYHTNFDFDREAVWRGWWEYARKFGTLLNMKSYYKVTIPASSTDGNVDLVIYAQTESAEGGVNFFVGLEEKEFNDQAQTLLLDFKKQFYIDDLLLSIQKKEQTAKKLGDAYDDTILEDEQQSILANITLIRSEIEDLKEEIRKIERK